MHQAKRRIYGRPRVYQVLRPAGERVSQNTRAKVMCEKGLRAKGSATGLGAPEMSASQNE